MENIWEAKDWPKEWTPSLVIPLLKKGNLEQCQNYCTMSLISHPSKILLRVILNWLKTKAEELPEEEQTGFIPDRRPVEQIFSSRIIIVKAHTKAERSVSQVIDFKNAFDRVWHAGLW